jgi:hypothetical protein
MGACANNECTKGRKHGSKFCAVCSANWRQLKK